MTGRFLCLLLMSSGAHGLVFWSFAAVQPPQPLLTRGEMSVLCVLSPSSAPRPLVIAPQSADLPTLPTPAEVLPPPTPAPAEISPPAEVKVNEVLPAPAPPLPDMAELLPAPSQDPEALPIPKAEIQLEKLPETKVKQVAKVEPAKQRPPASETLPAPKVVKALPQPEVLPTPQETKLEPKRELLPAPQLAKVPPREVPLKEPARPIASNPQPASTPSNPKTQGVRTGARVLGIHQPTYPPEARRRGLEGEVTLEIDVSAKGHPVSVKVYSSSGHGLLDDAALLFCQKLEFVPARLNGAAVETTVWLPMRYRLE